MTKFAEVLIALLYSFVTTLLVAILTAVFVQLREIAVELPPLVADGFVILFSAVVGALVLITMVDVQMMVTRMKERI